MEDLIVQEDQTASNGDMLLMIDRIWKVWQLRFYKELQPDFMELSMTVNVGKVRVFRYFN